MNWQSLANLNLKTMTKLWNESFEDYTVPIELTEEQLQQRIESLNLSTSASFIAEVNNEQAGIVLYGEEIFKGRKTAWIGGMGVIKPLREHGVGKAMVEKTIDMAKIDGIQQLHLEVIQGNDRAQQLYEKTGFELLSEVSIGSLVRPLHFQQLDNLIVEKASVKERHEDLEAADTVWQNRLQRGYELYDIRLDGEYIGYVSLQRNIATIKQISLKNPTAELFSAVLSELYDSEQLNELNFSNIDVKQPLYQFLLNNNYEEKLRQSHMLYQLDQ